MTRLDLLVNAVAKDEPESTKEFVKKIIVIYLNRRDQAVMGDGYDQRDIQYVEDAKHFDTVEGAL